MIINARDLAVEPSAANPGVKERVASSIAEAMEVPCFDTISVVTEFKNPFFYDHLLPVGNLREIRSGYKRADIIFVSKCAENLSEIQRSNFEKKLHPTKVQKVYYSSLSYLNLKAFHHNVSIEPDKLKSISVVLFTGIGNPAPLRAFLQNKCEGLRIIKFPDHHEFTKKDIEKITMEFQKLNSKEKIILTTEKDISRIKHHDSEKYFESLPLYYLPVKIKILTFDDENFDKKIINYVRENKREC